MTTGESTASGEGKKLMQLEMQERLEALVACGPRGRGPWHLSWARIGRSSLARLSVSVPSPAR